MQAEIGDYRGPLAQAPVSLADHGFLYGDAVYETVRTVGGRVFELPAHLERLRDSARGLYLDYPWSDEELTRKIIAFQATLEGTDHYLRLIITRGVSPLGYAYDPQQRPQCILLGGPFKALQPEQIGEGLTATVVGRRRNATVALSPHLKTNNLLNPRLAAMEAHRAGFQEALMLNGLGNFSEGTNCNVFFGRGPDLLVTPHLESGLLAGVTRKILLDLARANGMRVEERAVAHEELPHFREAFLSSTTRSISPLSRVDGWPMEVPTFPLSHLAPVTSRLIGLFVEKYGEL